MAQALNLTEFAAKQQCAFDANTAELERRERGHFGTPPEIADFMAGMFSDAPNELIRIIDPGAGVGTLTAAVCRRLCHESSPRRIVAELWENDPKLEPYLRATLDQCKQILSAAGHVLDYRIQFENFILSNGQKTLFSEARSSEFDLAILNPPYYKLRKNSAESRSMHHVVHGQPNIYALFMAAAADLLLQGGQMVAITPRSYFNGPYFKKFRKWFFERMAARQIHVFESRTEAFRDGGVLQENVILLAEKGGQSGDVTITTSVGKLFPNDARIVVPYRHVVENSAGDHIVRIASESAEIDIVSALDALPCRIQDLGLAVSTGPVVTFRATEYLRDEQSHDTAPLLWMHNVRPFITRFPPNAKKPGHLAVTAGSKRLLVPANRYILIKRFTAKEERKRLVAGIVESSDSYSPWLGLENHLNYVYRRTNEMTRAEALGLAAYLNSRFVDRYLRAVSGNTQVNATDLRIMPVPDLATIYKIGEAIDMRTGMDEYLAEQMVMTALNLPQRLMEQLCETIK